ncbi:MAG: efflux RND transporter permease subunit [Sedimentibacter sp.]|uniref:efflux RND transporter permease subunit n=1 Tax=Sedimentibacter sp. TaxID=1960295 RepID=UPI002981C387|nr:efflux RND transporter permease subunit [Sedimentibacter sp.]MDW5299220.1 efflux RND transporter permease subunit [Sedimentibacter sp.]
MKKFISFLLKEKYIVIAAFVITMVFGFISYYYMPRQENPDITSPAALITTIYPGASASDVELLVTKKIEEEVSKIDGIEKIDSYSNDNYSAVIVTISYTVDKEKQWTDLKNYIDNIKDELPEGCYTPDIDTESMVESAGMLLSISGDSLTYDQLENYAENLKQQLLNIDEINKVKISGGPDKKAFVEIDAMNLNTYSVSIEDIYNLLQSQNLKIPAGAINTPAGKINVDVPESFESLKDIENLIITASDSGGIVRLKDVASIYFGEKDNEKKIYNNGKSAVILAAYFKTENNIVLVGDEINESILKTKNSAPAEVSIDKITFQPDDVKLALNDFIINLFEGVLFVILIVLIGMGIRNALIVSISLPLTIFATFIAMYLFHIDLQQISIAGLIMAVGMVVDNSIVVSDAIQVRLNEGKSHNEASLMGVTESAVPVFSSTLTTVAALATLFVLPGEAGEFIKTMPVVIIVALSFSYIVSIVVVPVFASIYFKTNIKLDNYDSKTRLLFTKFLNTALNHKKSTVYYVFGFFAISLIIAVFVLPLEIFPYTDKNYIYIDVTNSKKGDLDSTYDITKQIEELLSSEPAVENITSSVGGYMPKFYLTSAIGSDTDDFSQIIVKFNLKNDKSFGKNKEEFMMHIQNKLNENIAGADMTAKLLALTAPGSDVEIYVTGLDRNLLIEKSNLIKNELMSIDGLYNINNTSTENKQEYYVDIDDDMATMMGLTKYDIQRQINIALSGTDATVFRTNGKEYDIFLKSNISSISQLENFKIKSSATGNKIMLKQAAHIGLKSAEPSALRYNKAPVIKITAEVASGYSAQIIQKKIENIIDNNYSSEEINYQYGGEKQTLLKYLRGLGIAGLISLAAIFIILMVQFNSLLQPLIILMTVPLSAIGSIFGLWIFNQPFSFTAGLGLLALLGIVVNNAILLIEYINRARQDGLTIEEACKSSVKRRFRPIMLTTVTTVVGLVPLAFSASSFFTPMAVTLMTGLMISTLLTLIVIPTLYSLIEK